jgi:hypothetical protein
MSRFSIGDPDDMVPARRPWGNPKKSADEAEEAETADVDGEEDATDEQIESRGRQLAEMQAQVEELRRNQQAADAEKLQAFEKKKRAAVAAGDTEEYDELRRQETQFYQNLASRGQQQQQNQDAAVTAKWIERNRWMSNSFLRGHAEAIAQRFADKNIVGAEQLRRVEREMRDRFGDMISEYEHGKPAKPGSRVDRAARSRRDWNSIPQSERRILEQQYFRPGAAQRLADTPATRARMAAAWWDQNHPQD